MKKLVIKCILMIGVFMGISQYFVYIMTGKSPLEGLKPPSFSLDSISAPSIENIATGGKQTVYKWVDANGVTQYSAEPPPDQVADTLEVDPNTNLVQGLKMEEEEEEGTTTAAPEVNMPQNIYSPGAVKKLIDDAKNVSSMLNERYNGEDSALKNL